MRSNLVLALFVVAAIGCGASSDSGTPGGVTTHDSGGHVDDSSIGVDSGGFDVGGHGDSTSGVDSSVGDDTGATSDTTIDTALAVDAGPTFGSSCAPGTVPKVTGTVFAPNGTDPVPNAEVYAPSVVNTYTEGVACDTCDKPIDSYYTLVKSGADGTFTLDLSSVPVSASVKIAVKKGRFRKVSIVSPACGADVTTTAAQTTLPGTTPTGEDHMPKIAVATGNSDHLDTILTALGITTYDCYEGRKTTSTNCPSAEATGKRVSALLTDSATLMTYNLLFISCAPGVWASYSASDQTTIAANLKGWVDRGGRLIVTDNSYDYVAQTWPTDLSWQGPTATPWTVDGANVGDVPSSGSYSATVDDADLTAWLKIVKISTAPTIDVMGWLHNWSVMSPVPSTSTEITHGSVQYTYPSTASATTADLPLTAEFIKNKCGRVIYSSYHTLSSVTPTGLTAQEKILEYLVLDVASCLRV